MKYRERTIAIIQLGLLLLLSSGAQASKPPAQRCELFAYLAHQSVSEQERHIREHHESFLDEISARSPWDQSSEPSVRRLPPLNARARQLRIEKVANSRYQFEGAIDDKRWGPYLPKHSSSTYQRWEAAHQKYVEKANSHDVSLETLREMHRDLLQGHYFVGFERRRVRAAFQRGELSREDALRKLRDVERGIPYSGVDHSLLIGTLRTDPMDDFVFNGDHIDSRGQRFLTNEEFKGMLSNPFFRLIPGSRRARDASTVSATFEFLPPTQVEPELSRLLGYAAQRLATAGSDEEYLRIAVALHRDLISMHPFLDGNGRTNRMFIDMILAQRNLALPESPVVEEYTKSVDQMLAEYVRRMRAWKLRKAESKGR